MYTSAYKKIRKMENIYKERHCPQHTEHAHPGIRNYLSALVHISVETLPIS